MFTVTRRSLTAHSRRLVGTLLAVLLGVSFLSGTLVLGDTMRSTFRTLFADGNAGTDVIVEASRLETDGGEQRGLVDRAELDRVRAVDGVARAVPVIEGFGRLVGKDGKPVGGMGPPTVAGNWVDDASLNPYRLAEGRAPTAANEVVINRAAMTTAGYVVGDTATIQTPEKVEVTIVGTSTFGELDSQGGLTFAAFSLAGAQEHVLGSVPGGADKLTAIRVAAAPGVTQDDLAARVQVGLPPGVEAKTGVQEAADAAQSINEDFLDFFTTFLLMFAVVAILVASFSIHNTFSILVAQRSAESALLRALGARRSQVLVATLAEALAVGLVASALGIAGGLGIAALLKGMFAAMGMNLPVSGLTLTGGTVLVSVAVGVVVTVGAAIAPSIRSSRIPPLAALREVSVDRTGVSAVRAVVGSLVLAIGAGLVLLAVTGAESGVLAIAGLGSLLTLVGMVVVGPVVAGRVSRLLGWPVAKTRGMVGRLARENAARNPRRTSGTASALMVGVGVVTLFTVFAASIVSSVDQVVGESFGGDLVVMADGFGPAGLSPDVATAIGAEPEVTTALGIGTAVVKIGDEPSGIAVTDLTRLASVMTVKDKEGTVAGVAPGQLAVSDTEATERGWSMGTVVPIAYADGSTRDFTVGARYEDNELLGSMLMRRDDWTPRAVQDADNVVLVELRDGVAMDAGRGAVESAVDAAGAAGATVQDRQQYVDSVGQGINQMLSLVYVMLTLAIVIALMGIANTLSLAVHERTRELGLLRAAGQTRRQVRSMVRWESVVIAVFGTVGGIGVGTFLGWALVKASSSEGLGRFTLPVGPVLVIVGAGLLAGMIAAIRPARRAARIDILHAIAA